MGSFPKMYNDPLLQCKGKTLIFFSVLYIGLALGIEPATSALQSSALPTELVLPRFNK